jgi:hypothetical protein
MSDSRHKKALANEGETTDMTSTYLLRQADALLILSRATFDLTVAGRLRVLAAEFRVKAQELERDGRIPREFAPANHPPQH